MTGRVAVTAALLLGIASCSPLRQAQDDTWRALPNSVILSERSESKGGAPHTTSPIQHVIFIIQENRSFNNLFMGFPGATTATFGYDKSGTKIDLRPISLSTAWDVGHDAQASFTDCDGQGSLPDTDCKMDGWNQEGGYGSYPSNAAYSYVKKSQIAPYWTMAKQYVLADETFSSNLDGSFIAHQYTVAAYASHAVNFPPAFGAVRAAAATGCRR